MACREPKYVVKVKTVIVGDGAVGKTTFAKAFLRDGGVVDTSYRQTIGADIHVKTVCYNVKPLGRIEFKWLVFDLAGQHYFRYVHKDYYHGAKAAIVMFDVSRNETLENLRLWISDFIKNVGKPLPMIIVGNKIDLRDEMVCVPPEAGMRYAEKLRESLGVPVMYAEASALRGVNVHESFYNLAKILVEYAIKKGKKLV